MKTLEDATERICELKGDVLALDVVLASLTQVLDPEVRTQWLKNLDTSSEFAATVLINTAVAEVTIESYAREVARWRRLLSSQRRLCTGVQKRADTLSGAGQP